MYLLVLIIPLTNFLLLIVFGRLLGSKFVGLLLFNLLVLLFVVLNIFYEVIFLNTGCLVLVNNWFSVGLGSASWFFLFDQLTVVMMTLIVLISSFVHIYSLDYMANDPHLIRFMSYLSMFTFFMLILVTSSNFVQLFAGWEGVGLSSYLLINFWYTRIQANKSAIKAVIINRFGDFGIYFAILIIFFYFKSFDFGVIFASVSSLCDPNVVDWIALFLVLGAFGKSAQIGLHTWLPDAMEGPTPVSALIHAATMVTAGVFVVLRCSPIIEVSQVTLFLISIVGALTAFFACTAGMVQNDIKRVIAYSTCSQLGYMFFACGVSGYSAALFHLFNHGFFKALLFLGAGSIIHAVFDEQDMRKIGALLHLMPVTYIVIFIGSLSIIGFPFTSGFYSKEFILGVSFTNIFITGSFIAFVGIIVACITTFYSLRLIIYVFFNRVNYTSPIFSASCESNSFIFYVLFILSFITIFIGFFLRDLFVGAGSDLLSVSIFQFSCINDLEAEFLPWYHKFIALFSSLFIAILVVLVYCNSAIYSAFNNLLQSNLLLINMYRFLIKRWYFDLIYNSFVFILLSFFYRIAFKLIDRGLIEWFGPLGIVRLISNFSVIFSTIQIGFIYNYIFMILFSTIVITAISFSYLFFSQILVLYFINFIIISLEDNILYGIYSNK